MAANAIIAIMAEANTAGDHSLLWGHSVEFWDRLGIWALIIGAVLGVTALVLTAVSAYVLYRVADKAQVELAAESKAGAERISANEVEIAKANAAAATANVEAARLRLELDREIQKRAPRQLNEDQQRAFIAAIAGQISAVTVFLETGWEPRRFATEIEIALSQAGVTIHEQQPLPNPAWPKEVAVRMVPFPPSNGAMMYAPGFTGNGAELKDDPLFKALTGAGIFGGGFNGPKLLGGFNPNEHALYIGEKAPW